MNHTAICTISSANYFPFAKTMLQSVATLHPECDLFYLLVDKYEENITNGNPFSIISLEELAISNLKQMTFVYDITEFNTAAKPFLLSFLLNKGFKKVIYLDPDIYVYNRLDAILNALDTNAIALTPHSLRPAPEPKSFLDKVQWEQNMTYTGIFNLGFIGISNTQETLEFLLWWKKRCQFLCLKETNVGIFVDQKWAELSIAFWKNIFIVRDPGYNMSIWNFHERALDNGLINKEYKLIFFHFSSIDIGDPDLVSRHDKNVRIDKHPELSNLFADYRKAVIGNDYFNYSKIRYAYDYFADGSKIDLLERRLYAMVADHYRNDPFIDSRRTFYRNIRKCNTFVNKETNGDHFSFASSMAYWLFRLIGAKRYRELAMFLGKSSQLRAHTFLLK